MGQDCVRVSHVLALSAPARRFALNLAFVEDRRLEGSVTGTTLVALGVESRGGHAGNVNNELEEFWIEGDNW